MAEILRFPSGPEESERLTRQVLHRTEGTFRSLGADAATAKAIEQDTMAFSEALLARWRALNPAEMGNPSPMDQALRAQFSEALTRALGTLYVSAIEEFLMFEFRRRVLGAKR